MALKILWAISTLAFLFNTISALPADTPVPIADAASSHNIYLLTCSARSRRQQTTFIAVAYFLAPISTPPRGRDRDRDPIPDQSALISDPAETWDHVNYRVRVWDRTIFSANVTAGSTSLAKGQIAGDAALSEESFVCFRDGETEIGFVDDDGDGRGGRRGRGWGQGWGRIECVADYWCASLS